MTNRPEWKHISCIGDRDPIAYGGGFVYQDTTGVYPPEMTWFEPAPDADWDKTKGATPLHVYRIVLDPPRFKAAIGGRYERGKANIPSERGVSWVWCPEWFVSHIQDVAESAGTTKFALLRMLFSKDPRERAMVYQTIIGHFGPFEFDQYPIEMTEDEAYTQYAEEMKLSLGRV